MTQRHDPMTTDLPAQSPQSLQPPTDFPQERGGTVRRPRRMTRLASAATVVLAAGVLLAGCGDKDSNASGPQKVGGEATPAAGDSDADKGGDGKNEGKGDEQRGEKDGNKGGDDKGDAGGASGDADGSDSEEADSGGSSGSSDESGSSEDGGADGDGAVAGAGASGDTRCHTGDLDASFGPNHPGAGQKNFSVVLTNKSGEACDVRGYPGLAFVNSAGEEVSIDPDRAVGEVRSITLSPGESAWAPLSFANPQMTGVTTVTPTAAKITPPDERASLTAPWSGGPVTNTGKASVPKIGPLSPGTGA
ncbi:DUF4232 domain-containing protein [Streptomyces albus]|uniref:DUF4232 domain-containing protein n=1 Tax=Streptomyces albus TaxID=1888 RepID=UPI0024ADF45A|nr:DUF4232 domain-containing protein [Streptomyces albus]MDI6411916.1 DUF4232 domain-containing protein [Streptomyces albus]